MKNIFKKIKVVIVILLVIVVSLIGFFGIFKKDKGVWSNLIPDYKYGMDVEGSRELKYALDDSEEEKYVYVDDDGNIKGEVMEDGTAITEEDESTEDEATDETSEDTEDETTEETSEDTEDETTDETSEDADETEDETTEDDEEEIAYAKETRTIKANEDDALTKENFEKTKKIVQKRLKNQDIGDYNIRIDDVTGNVMIETADDEDDIDLIEDLIEQQGKFEIIDYQNGLVLMDNSDIKNATVVTSTDSSYKTYLQIQFNKEGAQKLKDMSTKYVEITNEEDTDESDEETADDTSDETTDDDTDTTEEETEKKYVSVVFDDTTMMTTYFGEEMSGGILQISVGQERDEYSDFLEDYQSAQTIADILNSGVLPVKYELETDNFVKSEVTTNDINKIKIVAVVLVAIVSLIFVIKYKKNGLFVAVLSIGYIAVLSLVTRYTNVTITINAFIAYAIVIAMNYILMKMFMKNLENQEEVQAFNNAMKKFYLSSIPVCVIAIIFTFSIYSSINTIGMILFWGLVLNAIYNFVFTRTVFKK